MRASRLRALWARLPPRTRALLRDIAARADRSWRVALVGGPVRDLLLRRPLVDVDLVVEDPTGAAVWPAPELARRLQAARGGRVSFHPEFGTASWYGEGLRMDAASARRERYAAPGALPSVEPGTLEEDLGRRDFSVQAMALVFRPAWEWRDPFGGEADLRRRVLRVLHPKSFEDDPTRLLRAVRYAVRLGFRWERHTARVWRRAVRAGFLSRVSGGRLQDELALMAAEARAYEMALCLDAEDAWRPLAAAGAFPQAAKMEAWVRLGREAAAKLGGTTLPRSAAAVILDPLPQEVLRGLAEAPGPARVRTRAAFFWQERAAPVLRVGGRDLLRWGVPAGPRYRDLLGRLRREVLDRPALAKRSAQLAWLKLALAEDGRI